jgi:glutamate/tyrosine decarboxylase-like PLP-dependent enzyme
VTEQRAIDQRFAAVRRALEAAAAHGLRYVDRLAERPVTTPVTPDTLREALGGPLPEWPADPVSVVDQLVEATSDGLVATSGPRFFGFVVGGTLPAAAAADWLTTVWDQPAGLYVASPAGAVVEEIVGQWLGELFGLPAAELSFGFVTGGQAANTVGLAAARHHVLGQRGWEVERDGLFGAPPITVFGGEARHVSIDRSLRFLGMGERCLVSVAVDDQGRMQPAALARAIRGVDGPVIVCAQAGGVNTGAFDDFAAVIEVAREAGAWVHVDGAFGMWATVTDRHSHLTAGIERADSWAVDAHKWLNVPYDSGMVFTVHPDAHRAAMTHSASYLARSDSSVREQSDWNPESSRRARGFPIYAALRSLGRQGVRELVERCCRHAAVFAQRLDQRADVDIVNDVVLNQVLVRFLEPGGDDTAHDRRTAEVISRVQASGRFWFGGTTWRGMQLMRISIVNWATSEDDVEAALEAIEAAASS